MSLKIILIIIKYCVYAFDEIDWFINLMYVGEELNNDRKKTETFIFEGLGFPIILINAPWRKVFGEWALDINFKKLQDVVQETLINKPNPLTGEELRFIRKFLEMPTTVFGKLFGVSHVAVVKWENGRSHINPATELCIRLYVMDHSL